MKRSDKERNVEEVKGKASRASALYFTDFTGITVEEANELRSEFRKAGVDYRVVKNTLARKALTDIGGLEPVFEALQGPTAIAFGYGDPISPARIIKKFYDKNEKLRLKLCVVESQVFDGSRLNELAKLPSKKEIIASVLGSVNAPISGVVEVIGTLMRDVLSVIDAIEKQKAKVGDSAAKLAS